MAKLKLKKPKLKLKKPSKKLFTSTKLIASVLVVLGLGGLGYSGYYYYQNIFTDYDRVFYSMIDKSLNTNSVLRSTEQTAANRVDTQTVQLNFAPGPQLHTMSKLEQIASGSRQNSVVETETYADKENDYIQYSNIQIPEADGSFADYSKLLNTWAKRTGDDPDGNSQVQFLNEATFTFIPFGNFSDDQRAMLIGMMKDKKVYKLNQPKINYDEGRPVMTAVASINPKKFVEVMVEYHKLTGVGNLDQLDPEQYEDRNSFSIQVEIDVLSRHLMTIGYPSGDRTERFYAYGVVKELNLPEQTISIEELQGRLQN